MEKKKKRWVWIVVDVVIVLVFYYTAGPHIFERIDASNNFQFGYMIVPILLLFCAFMTWAISHFFRTFD